MNISVLVDEAGDVIAAVLPPGEVRDGEERGYVGITPDAGQTLRDLNIPDDQIPSEPGPEFLETLQRALTPASGTARG